MEKDPQILVNQIRTPDGTLLVSRHVHDYVQHTDKNGQYYAVDGGNYYLKRSFDIDDYEELSITEADPFEKIRQHVSRGGRGKDGKQPLKWVPICEMSNDWVKAVIDYEKEHRPKNMYIKYFEQELEYRKENDIFVADTE